VNHGNELRLKKLSVQYDISSGINIAY